MVMVPIDEFSKYRNLLFEKQVTIEKNPLQRDIRELRETLGVSIPDDQKAKLEGEIIERYGRKLKRTEPKLPVIDPEKLKYLKQSISNFSKTNKNRATKLYDYLESKATSRWNENGEILTSDGENISGSNILDLINFVTSTQKMAQIPKGFNDFVKIMVKANVPAHYMSQRGYDHMQNNVVETEEEEEDKHGEESFSTPAKKKRKKRKGQEGQIRWDRIGQ